MKRFAAAGATAAAIGAALVACGGDVGRAASPAGAAGARRPGLPAYWESQVPDARERPPAGTRFEMWPLLTPRRAPEGEPRGGTGRGDPFVGTEDGAPSEPVDAGSTQDPQAPLRMLDGGT